MAREQERVVGSRRRRFCLAGLRTVAALMIGGSDPASACSYTERLSQPSNFCLVEAADAIVLAKAVRQEVGVGVLWPGHGRPAESDGEVSSCVVFEPIRALKGPLPHDLCLAGYEAPSTGIQSSWAEPREGALAGGCMAYDYAIGHLYLLMLTRETTGWTVVSEGAFRRVNEEVSGVDDPWVAGIQRYVDIASLPSRAEKRKALEAVLETEKKGTELYKDSEKYLRFPWPSTPGDELVRFLAADADVSIRRRALFLAAGKPVEETRLAVDALLESPGASEILWPLAEYAAQHGLRSYWNRLVRISQEHGGEVEPGFLLQLSLNLPSVDPLLAVDVLARCKPPRCSLPSWIDALPEMLHARVKGHYPEFDREALLLATLDDAGVIAWAQQVLSEPEGPSLPLAIRVLASSSKGRDREFMQEVFCRHRTHVRTVLTAYSEAESSKRLDRVADLAVTPELSQVEKEGVLTLLRHWTRFEKDDGGESVARGLLRAIEQGGPPSRFFFSELEPLTCQAR
jgi:hypothetical protein